MTAAHLAPEQVLKSLAVWQAEAVRRDCPAQPITHEAERQLILDLLA
jgi:hypothetical protein